MYQTPDDREKLRKWAWGLGNLSIPWLVFALTVWKLAFLNTVWIGQCAYCMDADGSIWWGLLTPIANFGAFFPLMLAAMFWWWSEYPTPQWRRSEMFFWLIPATLLAPFWFMLSWIAFDLHTWVEGILHISNNYQFEDPNIYWTFSWIAIPVVGGLAVLPLYYSWKGVLFGLRGAPPPESLQDSSPAELSNSSEEDKNWWE